MLFVEIPRIYRETKSRVQFGGYIKIDTEYDLISFKYPGGEIPYLNDVDFLERLAKKKFNDEEITMILRLLVDTVSTEATISFEEVIKSNI